MVRRAAVILAGAVLAAGAAAPAAGAATAVEACTVSGEVDVTPRLPALLTGPLGVRTSVFTANATCEIVLDGQQHTTGAFMQASGPYTNVVCGTGTAHWEGFISFSDASIAGAEIEVEVALVNGVATLAFTTYLSSQTSGRGSGALQLVPDDGGDCIERDVGQFAADGAFTIAGR